MNRSEDTKFDINPLYPVILAVPPTLQKLTGRAKVHGLSILAREALSISCRKSQRPLNLLKKDSRGAPLPENENHWSVSHKSRCVAAVVAPYPIGIDIEEMKPYPQPIKDRVASQDEWQLGSRIQSDLLFLRFWTAKEAVLKAVGVGISGLSRCRVTQIIDKNRLRLIYEQTPYTVAQTVYHDHLTAVIVDNRSIFWTHLSKCD